MPDETPEQPTEPKAAPTAAPATSAIVPAAETPQEAIDLPDYDQIEEDEGRKAGTDPDGDNVHVTVIEKGWGDTNHILIALIYVSLVLFVPFGILRYLYGLVFLHSVMATLVLTVIVMHFTIHRFLIGVDMMKAEVYMDEFTGELFAYKLGFYVIAPWMSLQQTIDFRNDEIKISAMYDQDEKKTSSLRISTNDPYQCDLEWELLARPLEDAEGIRNFLRYKPEVRESRIRAVMNSRLSIIGGKYKLQTLLTHAGDVSQWVRKLFKSDGEVTEFEHRLGVSVISPRLRSILCNDPAAKEVIRAKPQGELVEENTRRYKELGVDPNLSFQGAMAISGAMELVRQENVHHFVGLEHARTVALGAGAFIGAGGGQGGGQGNGNRNDRKKRNR
ncbi:MAG TPA: hypothetical protein VHE10_01085 [Candidatus Paceibacterota bacterium]|nr:hypothetical protein [Candidatus Paceibacterota bacterium]